MLRCQIKTENVKTFDDSMDLLRSLTMSPTSILLDSMNRPPVWEHVSLRPSMDLGFLGQRLKHFAYLHHCNKLERFSVAFSFMRVWHLWVSFDQGDQIGRFFCQLGYFWRLIMIFWKDEVAQNNGDFLGKFLLKEIYYIFT